MAENEDEARDVFIEEQGDIIEQGIDQMNEPAVMFLPLKQDDKLPHGWGQSCIPFGETGDRTIEQIWEAENDAD